MRARTFLLLTLLWIWPAAWLWREYIPLVPTTSVQVPPNCHARLWTRSEIAILPVRSGSHVSAGSAFGPIEFWSFPEGRKSRTFLTAEDQILHGPLYRTGEILVRRQGRLEVWNSLTQERVTGFPDLAEARRFEVVPGQRQVLQCRRELHLFDFDADRPRWTKPVVLSGRPVGGLFIAREVLPQTTPKQKVGVRAFRIEDGRPDNRFDALAPSREIQFSNDGRWAATRAHGKPWTICDFRSGQVLWTAPIMPAVYFCFSDDGDEFYGYREPARVLRWRSRDGEPLPDLTDAEQRAQHNQVTSDGRYAIKSVITPGPTVARWLTRTWMVLDSWRIRLQSRMHRIHEQVIDNRTERVIGYVVGGARPFALKDIPGIVAISDGRIDFYKLPPRRDYWSLAGFALGPPVAMALLLRLRSIALKTWTACQQGGAISSQSPRTASGGFVRNRSDT